MESATTPDPARIAYARRMLDIYTRPVAADAAREPNHDSIVRVCTAHWSRELRLAEAGLPPARN